MEYRRQTDRDINEIKISIAEIIGSISKLSDSVKEQHDFCYEQCQRINKILLGNGSGGLITRVSSLEQSRKNQPTPRESMLFGTVGGAIIAFIGWILGKMT